MSNLNDRLRKGFVGFWSGVLDIELDEEELEPSNKAFAFQYWEDGEEVISVPRMELTKAEAKAVQIAIAFVLKFREQIYD